MGAYVIGARKVWIDGFDLSGDHRAVALDDGIELLEATVFGDAGHRRAAGLFAPRGQLEGYWNGDANRADPILFPRVGSVVIATIGAQAGAEGEAAYTFQARLGEYAFGAAVGEMLPFSVPLEGSEGSKLIRSTILHNATQTATANGTARQLGQVSATQKLYAALHVLAASGATPTLDVKVQSDNVSGMTTPIDRITFAQKTAVGAEWAAPVAGAITDDWWRVTWTIGGAGPSFTFVVAVGIL